MDIYHNLAIVASDKPNALALYSVHLEKTPTKAIYSFELDDEQVMLCPLSADALCVQWLNKEEFLGKIQATKLKKDDMVSSKKSFSDEGAYFKAQATEESLYEGDFLAIYNKVRQTVSVVRIVKIRQGISAWFFGKYKLRDINGQISNTGVFNPCVKENKNNPKEAFPLTLYRLFKEVVVTEDRIVDGEIKGGTVFL